MNRLFVLLSFVLGTTATFAQTQKYHPFKESDAFWIVNANGSQGAGCYEVKYFIDGDTVLNGLTYNKIKRYGWYGGSNGNGCDPWANWTYNGYPFYVGGLRNDTIQRKVYFWRDSDTTESLLYDFSLGIGDTLQPGINNQFNTTLVVHSFDSVLVGTNYRRKIYVNIPGLGFVIGIIEGIGSQTGLIEDLLVGFGFGSTLKCYGEGNQTMYPSSPNSTLCQFALGQEETELFDSPIVFPNPFSDQLIIRSATGNFITRAVLYNLNGQELCQWEGRSMQVQLEPQAPSGFYTLHLELDNNAVQVVPVLKGL
jgi:hypothetical protein